jgi:nitroimidazol reductase NimA-like FMN-containing flavoprotein (pyridoxamine 5'-phosphate oxidase superfamily)
LTYTQPPHMTEEEVESLLKEAKYARFCSHNKDGTIHATPAWFWYENNQIIIMTPEASRKARNVRRDNRVTILVDISGGEAEWSRGVTIYGKAEPKPQSNPTADAISWAEKYMPREKAEHYVKAMCKLTSLVKITVKPERLASFDYSKDETYHRIIQEVWKE